MYKYVLIFIGLVSCASVISPDKTVCESAYDACMNGTRDQKLDCIDGYKNCVGIDFTFPVNFVVVTDNGSANTLTTLSAMENIITTLNTYFAAEDCRAANNKKSLVSFELESYLPYAKAKLRGSLLFTQLSAVATYDGDVINDYFNEEGDHLIRNPNAINVYIYDSGLDGDNGDDKTGHGRYNKGRPYILLDYARINTREQAAEEHEMGHAFGLEHICNSMITEGNQSSNIMTTSGKYPPSGGLVPTRETYLTCKGFSAGLRDIGFSPEQARIVLEKAVSIHAKLNL